MKTRASNLMIGSTTLAVIAAAFVGFLGFQKIHGIQQRGPLRIVFEGSASGLRKGGNAFASFDSAMTKIDNVVPSLADGKADELFEKVKSIRELAESFNKRSGALMEEGRRSLLDISQAAIKVTRKFEPQAGSGDN